MRFGALEAGGTKMVCAIGDENGTVLEQISIPTRTPEETIPKIIQYFKDKNIAALGVAAFGPVDVNKNSKTYGYILDTPKLAWRNYDFIGSIKKEISVPIGLDTDVNGSCLGEMTYGCAKGLGTVIYITIGTGIGAGISVDGKLVHGILHPEAGHIILMPHPEDTYKGKCPYHGNCFEGMASGPAIEERWGQKAINLVDRKEVWELEAFYIAQALMAFVFTVMPNKIILGGGVMHQMQLFPMIRNKFKELINGYINTKEMHDLDNYIVPASLQDNQGIMGCIQLAKLAFEEE